MENEARNDPEYVPGPMPVLSAAAVKTAIPLGLTFAILRLSQGRSGALTVHWHWQAGPESCIAGMGMNCGGKRFMIAASGGAPGNATRSNDAGSAPSACEVVNTVPPTEMGTSRV